MEPLKFHVFFNPEYGLHINKQFQSRSERRKRLKFMPSKWYSEVNTKLTVKKHKENTVNAVVLKLRLIY